MAWLNFGKNKKKDAERKLIDGVANLNRERGNQLARLLDVMLAKLGAHANLADPEALDGFAQSLRGLRDGFVGMSPIVARDMKDFDTEVFDCLKVMGDCIENDDAGTLTICIECLHKAVMTRPEAKESDVIIMKLHVSRSKLSLYVTLCGKAKLSHESTLKEVLAKRDALKAYVDEATREGKQFDELEKDYALLTNYGNQIKSIKTQIDMQDTTAAEYETQLIALKMRLDGVGGVITAEEIKEITELSNKIGAEHVAMYASRMSELAKAGDAARAITKTAE